MAETLSSASQTSHIKTCILIISDTHNTSLLAPTSSDIPFRSPLPSADVLIHCGDLTMTGFLHEYEATMAMIKSINAPLKLVIAGNHDISLDGEYYARKGRQMHSLKEHDSTVVPRAREMWTGEEAKKAGVRYLDEGCYTFVLRNGARLRVYASQYQPAFCDWAFPYSRNQDRYNPADKCTPNAQSIAINPIPDFPAIDIAITHGPPKGIRDNTMSGESVGCQHLLRAVSRCKPKLHCFGHIHEGWGAERVRWKSGSIEEDCVETSEKVEVEVDKMREQKSAFVDISDSAEKPLQFGKETLMVNASIMNFTYKPWQGPWLVDLGLERATEGEEGVSN